MEQSIQAIDKKSIHQICSGQVVLDLATAIKELVENSLDAAGTNIEIKLKEYGTECIEVSDNGHGIHEKDFQSLALKHYTSKLKEFTDLTFLETFGFRGEALSSLSALANIVVSTKYKDADVGSRLVFDHGGKLTQKKAAAHAIGTSVSVSNLFYTLPVRYKEFHRNIKREFSKAMNILYAYCLVNNHVRFTCVNQVGTKRKILISTSGSGHVTSIISSVFGATQAKEIIEIEQYNPDATVLDEFNLAEKLCKDYNELLVLSGFISKIGHGCGRSTADRQFFYVNKRPCDFPKLSRVVNEVYRMFNQHQLPFVFLEISFERDCVDINVTPNKRQIMIHQEKILFATLKCSLKKMFESSTGSYKDNSVACKNFLPHNTSTNSSNNLLFNESLMQNSVGEGNFEMALSPLEKFKINFSPKSDTEKMKPEQTNLEQFFETVSTKKRKSTKELTTIDNNKKIKIGDLSCKVPALVCEEEKVVMNQACVGAENQFIKPNNTHIEDDCKVANGIRSRKTVFVDFNIEDLKLNLNQCSIEDSAKNSERIATFRAKISPNDNVAAEDELCKNVTKEMFLKMDIVGQFNLGFIVASFKNNLFLIDQHATDEKYNFEMLQKRKCLKSQLLIEPLPLELTVTNKSVLMDNIGIFRKNGFEFKIIENDDDTQVKLLSMPSCRNWTFSAADVEELIFMLSDAPGVMCRPSRVRQMFASWACRTSVMVGTALKKTQMQKIIAHMNEMEHPWNCPHGRPTMRHLICLDRIDYSTL